MVAPAWWMKAALLLGVAALMAYAVHDMRSSAYQRGVLAERARLVQAQADALATATRESARLGRQMAATAQAEAQASRANEAALRVELRRRDRTPLLVSVAGQHCRAAAGPGPDAAAPGAARDPALAAVAAAAAVPPTGSAGPGLAVPALLPHHLLPDADRLTLAAVSLWDSALAGRPVPAGACRADDLAASACAAASGYSLADAIDNHLSNATACREDRARHRALIAYLQAREGAVARSTAQAAAPATAPTIAQETSP